MVVTEFDVFLRLVVAAAVGALIGLERERQNQPAGLRTHIILAVGSCLAMLLSIEVATQYRPQGFSGDPARIAAQVVSGIGFLGAGAILRFGNNIRGLTTATSLWTLAIIGLAVGAGHFIGAGAAGLILLIALTLLDRFEKRFIRTYTTMPVTIRVTYHAGILNEVRTLMKDNAVEIIQTSMTHNFKKNEVDINLVVKTLEDAPVDALIHSITALDGLRSFKVN